MWMEHHCIVDPGKAGGQPRPEFTPEDPRSRIFWDAQNWLAGHHTTGAGGFNSSGLPMGFLVLADKLGRASNEKSAGRNELILVVGGAMIVVIGVGLG